MKTTAPFCLIFVNVASVKVALNGRDDTRSAESMTQSHVRPHSQWISNRELCVLYSSTTGWPYNSPVSGAMCCLSAVNEWETGDVTRLAFLQSEHIGHIMPHGQPGEKERELVKTKLFIDKRVLVSASACVSFVRGRVCTAAHPLPTGCHSRTISSRVSTCWQTHM